MEEIEILHNKIIEQENQIKELKNRLSKYTNPTRNKKFYENHKEEMLKKMKEYKIKKNYAQKENPEKRKEYNRRYYEKKKKKSETQN